MSKIPSKEEYIKNLNMLSEAIKTGVSSEIAHALIAFEYPNPTIDKSVNKATKKLLKMYLESPTLWLNYNSNEVEKAKKARRDRLGDDLWFSRY